MKAYKLFRAHKDGSISSLFINKTVRLPLGTWLEAKPYKTKGFAFRPGWHCTHAPVAPHLSTRNRVWAKVEIENFTEVKRPESQGGLWYLANQMRIVKVL